MRELLYKRKQQPGNQSFTKHMHSPEEVNSASKDGEYEIYSSDV